MKKIGISTDIGYNYGSMLQAYATLQIIRNMGYDAVVFKPGGSLIKGKDMRPEKLAITLFRMLLHSKDIKKSVKVFTSSYSKEMAEGNEAALTKFLTEKIAPKERSISQLKKIGQNEEYEAFICGSDQIWITDSYYIDPFYYLSYAPAHKRIALSPSFGRENVPQYNQKAIAEKLESIPYLSVREQSGVKIIKELTNRDAEVIIDPSFMLSAKQWKEISDQDICFSKFLLAYFLDEPSDATIDAMKNYAKRKNLKIVSIPYLFAKKYSDYVAQGIGPLEFVNLIAKADTVFTDSFHGTAFSLNLGTPFYTFDRNYGTAANQSTRIKSILQLTNTENRFFNGEPFFESDIDVGCIQKLLSEQRQKAIDYLDNAIKGVKNHG